MKHKMIMIGGLLLISTTANAGHIYTADDVDFSEDKVVKEDMFGERAMSGFGSFIEKVNQYSQEHYKQQEKEKEKEKESINDT